MKVGKESETVDSENSVLSIADKVCLRKRTLWIDFDKSIAIFLVLLGHAVQYAGATGPNNPMWSLIYSFHMPLFMFMSGLFAHTSANKSFFHFVGKKFVQLLLPVFSWVLLSSYFLSGYHLPSFQNLCFLVENMFWFLHILFFCYLVWFLFKRIFRNDYVAAFFSIVIVLVLPIASYYFRLFCFMLPFFWCGYFFNRYQTFFMDKWRWLFAFAILIFVILLIPWRWDYTVYFSDKPWFSFRPMLVCDVYSVGLYLYRFIIGLSGTLVVMFVGKLLYERFEKCRYMPYILHIGTSTLGIYIVQTYLLEFFIPDLHLNFTVPLACVAAVFIALSELVLCWRVVCWLDKFYWSRLFLLGKNSNFDIRKIFCKWGKKV